jgi:hypothetical protein
MCIDYRKPNTATKKDHFLLPFIDEMLEQLAKYSFFCFLDGYSDIIRFLSTPMIKARQHLHARMEHTHIVQCGLGCVMHPLHFNGA